MLRCAAVLALIGLCTASAAADEWPQAATQYRPLWKKEFRRSGLHPDYETLLLGQLTQESRWDPNAVSPVGAKGLAQFMGGTVRLMERAYGEALRGLGGPREPVWAFRAYFLLMKENLVAWRLAPTRPVRYRWGAAAYNGGPRWLRAEKRLLGGAWGRTWAVCRKAGRSASACTENIEYADHAIRFAPRFRGY